MLFFLFAVQARPVVERDWQIEFRDETGKPLSKILVRVGLPDGEPQLVTDQAGRIRLRTPAYVIYLGLAKSEPAKGWYWVPNPPRVRDSRETGPQVAVIQVEKSQLTGDAP